MEVHRTDPYFRAAGHLVFHFMINSPNKSEAKKMNLFSSTTVSHHTPTGSQVLSYSPN